MNARRLSAGCSMLMLLCASAMQARAQTATAKTDESTIHVYTNLLQIPVLVLGPNREALPPIDPKKFTVNFDGGKPFRPRHVRLEGEDPVTLAILIDGSRHNNLLPELADALAAVTLKQLRPQDRFVVYTTDGCRLRRFGEMLPAQTTLVRVHVQDAVAATPPAERGNRNCTASLWSSVAMVTNELRGEPGRRILLAVTNGIDRGHAITTDMAREMAINSGVAIFSVAEAGKVPFNDSVVGGVRMGPPTRGGRGGGLTTPPPLLMQEASDLSLLSENTGGMLMETTKRDLQATLTHFVQLLRGRYIVEFSRPENMTAGEHRLEIAFGQPMDFIRSAGTSMPVADPTESDPTVLHGVLVPDAAEPDTAKDDAPAAGAKNNDAPVK